MAETKRDRSTILGYIPATGGGHGDWTAQQLRDAIYSMFGSYGAMYTTNGSTAQSSIGTTPVKMTLWATNGVAEGMTVDSATDDDITVDTAGIVAGIISMSFSGTANATFTCELRKNAAQTGFAADRKLGTGGDVGSMAFGFCISVAASDVLTVYINADAGASNSITLVEGSFIAVQIA